MLRSTALLTHSPRVLLLLLLCAHAATSWTPAPLYAQSPDIVEVAPGVLAILQPPQLRFFDSNSVVIVNDNDVVVVDAQANPRTVRALIDSVTARTDKPVRTLVNTHWHGDHTQGNIIWRDAIGDELEIIGHATHRMDIEHRAKAQAEADANELEATLRKAEDELAEGRGLQGEALDEDGRMALRARLDRNWEHLATLRAQRWEPPSRTFEDRLVLDGGSRSIELRHYQGHTRGDIVLYLPKEKVLITGDLVDDLPFGGHGNPRQWLATLRRLEKIDFDILIPGHGQVRRGKDHLVLIREMVESILTQVDAAVAEGADLETTQKRVDLTRFRQALATDEVAERNFDDFLPATIEQAWLVSRGEWRDYVPDTH